MMERKRENKREKERMRKRIRVNIVNNAFVKYHEHVYSYISL